ncbi:MAG TPA: protein kinase [Bacteroidota bacterium]|nr:protein kinase [Bacteroidota bacterium]
MKKIGKYEIVEELGRGGMGVVYRAYDPTLEREVALKVIQQIALDVADTKARFYREARMAARLSHDAIAVIYEIGEEAGVPFIAMEYLPGRDLRGVIDAREPLSLDQKLDYARQVARGLQYAHAKNVIHRDIKPENIKLLDDGRVKIIDFGIAKPYTPTASPEDRSTSAVLTRMGMRIGTPWYMSPEQARGNPVDRRTDIFSFGVVLYELLTYAKPFQGDDTTVLYKILHEEPPPIKLEESGLADEIQRILSRCLAKDHEERYGDCAEVLRDLVALTEGASQDPKVRALLAQGIALDRAEKYDEAAAKFNQILEVDPDNPQARAFLKRLSLRDREAFMRKVLAGDIIGTVISHFQILDRIGGGGMGVVYKAEDMSLKRIVALKFLMPDLVRDPSAKKRFLKEAQAASALDHPNICTIHEISETSEGLLFICMAFYGGENLSTRIAAGPLEPGAAIDVVVRIGRGLAKAHEYGIVHRDIKPANVIITSEGEVKIVDFGLAKLSGGTQITRVGARMGTLPYMSPEQIRGNTLDHRTDIWSLGVLLFQTLTGQLPFQREYEAAMLYAIVTDDPPLLTSVMHGLPVELEQVISRALRKDPGERYASVQTMVQELERVQGEILQTKELGVARAPESEALLREARDLLKHGRYGEALARVERVLEVAPADSRARELKEECSRRLTQAEQVTVLLRQGTEFFDRGKFREARDAMEGVLAVEPAQPDATRILEQANEGLDRREQIDKLIAEAVISLKQEKPGAAASAYRRVLVLDPDNREAQKGLRHLEKPTAGRREGTAQPGPVFPRAGTDARPSPGVSRRRLWSAAVLIALVAVVVLVLIVLTRKPEGVEAPGGASVTTGAPAAAEDSEGAALAARSEMSIQEETARKAGAPTTDAAGFAKAHVLQDRGDGEFRAKSYGAARQAFEEAGALFRKSSDAAKADAASSADISELKQMITSARGEMLGEKSAAQKSAGNPALLPTFNDGLKSEREGDRLARSSSGEDLQNARKAYLNARDLYRKSNEDAAVQAALRTDADNAAAAMRSAREGVSGGAEGRKANSSYRTAQETETGARALYQSGDYAGARDAFARAGSLYKAAAREMSSAAEKPPAAETPASPKSDAVALAAEAGRSVRHMVDQYEACVEKGDLAGLAALLNLSDADRIDWSKFFDLSEQRSLTISDVEPDLSRSDPQVTFRERMSYFNTSMRQTVTPPEQKRVWLLQAEHGAWKVTSYK